MKLEICCLFSWYYYYKIDTYRRDRAIRENTVFCKNSLRMDLLRGVSNSD